MDDKKYIMKQTVAVAVGVFACVAIMICVFALLGYFDWKVLAGGIIGGVLSVANFLFMAIGTSLAADKAQQQDVKGGQALIRYSYILRLIVLFIVLFACIKGGIANPLALVLPLAFVRPVLTVAEFFERKGV